MIFKILNRCDFFIRNNSKFHVINVMNDKFFFAKLCENAEINLKNIIVQIFVFVIKNDDHDFIFELFKKPHNVSIIEQTKKKINIIFLTLIEKLNTFFEIILKINIFSNENFSFNLKIFVKNLNLSFYSIYH